MRLLNLAEQSNNDIEELDTIKSAIINTSKEIKDLENMRKGLMKGVVWGTAIILGIIKSKDKKSTKKK